MLVPNVYENLHALHENTIPCRAYYIPASRPMGPLVENREVSDRFQLLSGSWRFQYHESIHALKDPFWNTGFDDGSWDAISVPGVWQCAGYDQPQYTNIRYPFPFDPPFVPQDNPCGAYLHRFHYQSDPLAPEAFLNFEGVDSFFYVWLNGHYVGYSQVSHSTSEFRVTEFLQEGENTLAVLVLKWCVGSYLEDQDKFRTSGIFRDVYLLKRPVDGIFDYSVRPCLADGSASIRLHLDYFHKPCPVDITLLDFDGNALFRTLCQQADLEIPVPNPRLWSPEDPCLYTILLQTEAETITERVGLREIRIIDRVVHLNGVPIKFRGVNRHDSDPLTGPAVDLRHQQRDLLLMKQHNFNAIRTSHYPNAPFFCQLCDEYGFLVIGEADIEAHGPAELYYENPDPANASQRWNEPIADQPDFREAILDRVQRCVLRDKNRTSIVIWSLGNESAYGCCFEDAAAWVKSFDPDRLTQYESAIHHGKQRKYDFSNLDLYSRMYPSIEETQQHLDQNPDKPVLLVEYCHAMGNGPGDLEDYFQFFYSHPLLCGGFVWEWCDHAVDHGHDASGRRRYFYGGDHGEAVHDGNFCMDGLVYPDRAPHTGLQEYKNVYRPARAEWLSPGKLRLRNYLDFTDLREYVTLSYELRCDGELIGTGRLDCPSIPPHESGVIRLDLDVPTSGKCFLRLLYQLNAPRPLLPAGYEVGFDELPLSVAGGVQQTAARLLANSAGAPPLVSESAPCLVLQGEDFRYAYDLRTGLFDSLHYRGQSLLVKPMEVNIWRAPTDNDSVIKAEWMRARYHWARARAYETSFEIMDHSVVIRSRMALTAPTVQPILSMDTVWTVWADGAMDLHMDVQRAPEFPELPRFGLRLFLPRNLDRVAYCGMGPWECYPDKHQASWHGLFSSTVDKLHEDYVRPQENGSHWDCDWVTVDGGALGLTAVSSSPFSFNASPYTQEELTAKAHNFELLNAGCTVLCLDCAHAGVGSNSCGPRLLPQYRLTENNFSFHLRLSPHIP